MHMALPAAKFESEMFMDERMARLEANVEHIQSDVTEIKGDLRQLSAKVDDLKDSMASSRVETITSIGSLRQEMRESGTSLREENRESVVSLRTEMRESIASLKIGRAMDRVWWLLMLAALLGVMARGFKWI
jgi:peptidoglycan hydrolase CwlO-like protein